MLRANMQIAGEEPKREESSNEMGGGLEWGRLK